MSEPEKYGAEFEDGSDRKRRSTSLFGPIILIAMGFFFLLGNFGLLPAANWASVFRLWPVLLIFIGIGVLVQQLSPPWGTLLSGLTALAAVAFFGYVLFFGGDLAINERLGVSDAGQQWNESQIAVSAGDAARADVAIDFGSASADLQAQESGGNLLAGTVFYGDELLLDEHTDGDTVVVRLDTRDGLGLVWFNPASWVQNSEPAESRRWRLDLDPDLPTDLDLDIGSGAVNLALGAAALTALSIDGGSGSLAAVLPSGEYDLRYDGGSGSSQITLPASGRLAASIETGSGSIQLLLPAALEARIAVNGGSGSFDLPRDRFQQVSGDEEDDGVWVTADYDTADDRIELLLDVGSGSVNIRQP